MCRIRTSSSFIFPIIIAFFILIVTVIVVSSEEEPTTSKQVVSPSSFFIPNVPIINQYKEGLPTGCECTALAQLLIWSGIPTNPKQLAIMIRKEPYPFPFDKTTYYGGNPHRAFVGDPFSSSLGMGVFDLPIAQLIHEFHLSNNSYPYKPKVLSSLPFNNILEYLAMSRTPIVVWTTLKQREPRVTEQWYDYKNVFNLIQWKSPEHAVTLVGFNETHVQVNDVDLGESVFYDRNLFAKHYVEIGSFAVGIERIF
ncbi:hypothetical protein ABK040_014474 [Willaertia magna]